MTNEYYIEDGHMASCTHPSSVILYMRVCAECGKTLVDDVIEPGTETLTHTVKLEITP